MHTLKYSALASDITGWFNAKAIVSRARALLKRVFILR